MKIIHVVVDVGNRGGGVATMIRSLILQQMKDGHQPIVLSSALNQKDFKEWCTMQGIEVPYFCIEKYRLRRMTVWGGLSCKNYKIFTRKYEKEDTIFHFHNPIGVGILGKIPPNSICTIHSFIGKIFSSKITNLLATLSFKRLKKRNINIVACCQAMSDYLREKYGLQHITTILNGISDITKTENKYVPISPKIHIGYAAVLNELKGWRILAQAYELLPISIREKCDLTFAGKIVPSAQKDFDAFLARNQAVRYVGFLPNASSSFIPYLDVFVLPSRSEGLPMSLLEAMQQGVVPIATAVGGIPELIENNESGFLVSRSPQSLAQCLEQVIVNPEKLVHAKQQTKKRFKELGTIANMAKHYSVLYEAVVGQRGRK